MSDERKFSAVDVSKLSQVTSEPRPEVSLGIGLGDSRLLPRWCPAYRQHEPGPGSRMERVKARPILSAGRAVAIPKKGGTRILGIPNVVDRVAQTAAVLVLEPEVEQVFHDDSYGYRPGRSPVDAVRVCRQRCFKRDWVVDLDVKAFFDSVP